MYISTNPLLYLGQRFLKSIIRFFEHWYIESFRAISHFMLNVFEGLDKYFALRVTLRNIFKPLYQDRTFIGYILGFIFRSMRLVITSVVYSFVFVVSLGLYLLWLFIPVFIIYKILI